MKNTAPFFQLVCVGLLAFAACAPTPDRAAQSDDKKPPLFSVDQEASGPLTLDELKINLPKRLTDAGNTGQERCILETTERLAIEAGDPLTVDPADLEFLSPKYTELGDSYKRIILTQAIITEAFSICT